MLYTNTNDTHEAAATVPVCALCLVLSGLMGFAGSKTDSDHGSRSSKWPSTNGIALKSTYQQSFIEGSSPYKYSVNGKTYISRRFSFPEDLFAPIHQLETNKEVQVHYNPQDPSIACLQRGVNGKALGSYYVLFGAVELLGLFFFLIGARSGPLNKKRAPEPPVEETLASPAIPSSAPESLESPNETVTDKQYSIADNANADEGQTISLSPKEKELML